MQNKKHLDVLSVELNHAGGLVELQAAALEATANAVVITDPTGTIICVNSAFERLTGYGRGEIVGQSTRLLKSGQTPHALYEQMWRTILGGEVWRGELRNRRKDGSLYDEEMTITPVQSVRGEITHYIAVKLDISQRKQVEEALFAEKERAQVTLNCIGDAVVCVDRDTGLDSRSLELELTESVLMKRPESTEYILKTLKAAGVRVAVDDFGTGYSSLSYLRKFPIDVLKIDQSFVSQITIAPGETTIVTAVIGMGRSLKMRVVAEGVETQAELAFLRVHHCHEAQGYYFSRPVAPRRFAELLKTGLSETVLR